MAQILFKSKTICFIILVILSLTINYENAFGQGNISITGGLSTAELFNTGVRYRIKQLQIGLCVGFIPAYSYKSLAVSGNLIYHILGTSKFSDLRPWYGKAGILYMLDEDEYILDKGVYLPVLIGREFNISNKFGINFELGLAFLIHNDRTIKKIRNSEFGESEAESFPCFGVGCFYKL